MRFSFFTGVAQARNVGQLFRAEFAGAVMAGLQLFDALGVDVEADGVGDAAELGGQRQAEVAEADDGNAGVVDAGHGGLHAL